MNAIVDTVTDDYSPDLCLCAEEWILGDDGTFLRALGRLRNNPEMELIHNFVPYILMNYGA